MSSQTSSVPSILADRTAFHAEAAFYATCLVRVGDSADVQAIAAYGQLIASKQKPQRPDQVNFYRAMTNARRNGHLPGYDRVDETLRDYPERYGELEDLIARGVYEVTVQQQSDDKS